MDKIAFPRFERGHISRLSMATRERAKFIPIWHFHVDINHPGLIKVRKSFWRPPDRPSNRPTVWPNDWPTDPMLGGINKIVEENKILSFPQGQSSHAHASTAGIKPGDIRRLNHLFSFSILLRITRLRGVHKATVDEQDYLLAGTQRVLFGWSTAIFKTYWICRAGLVGTA